MNNNFIAIIPARGGSKGLPRKNILPLSGEPLIVHSIQQALASRQISATYVTTDDSEIADISSAAGAEVILRPDDLSGDKATSESALLHVLSQIEGDGIIMPHAVVFLQCTSPVRPNNDIDRAIDRFRDARADSLLSVVENHRFFWKEENGVVKSANYDYRNRQRRQDFGNNFVENGSIYISKTEGLREHNNRLFGKVCPYIMGPESAYEIDNALDFTVVETIFKSMNER